MIFMNCFLVTPGQCTLPYGAVNQDVDECMSLLSRDCFHCLESGCLIARSHSHPFNCIVEHLIWEFVQHAPNNV